MTHVQSPSSTDGTESVLDLLNSFAETGDKHTLQLINDIFSSKGPVSVTPELAMNVSNQISKLIEMECTNLTFWECQIGLMKVNLNLHEYLQLLQNSPTLVKFLQNLAENLNKDNIVYQLPFAYLHFLCVLVHDSYERQSIIFDQEGQPVIKAVEAFCDNIILIVRETHGFAFFLCKCSSVIAFLAQLHPEALEQNDQRSILWFLNMGGISMMSKMFMEVINHSDVCKQR